MVTVITAFTITVKRIKADDDRYLYEDRKFALNENYFSFRKFRVIYHSKYPGITQIFCSE